MPGQVTTRKAMKLANLSSLLTILLLASPSHGQSLPALRQGKPYASEREKLINAGWQKVVFLDCYLKNHLHRNRITRDTCFRYQEVDDCSASGHCSFLWRDVRGAVLQVETLGEGYSLLNWTLK